MLGLMAMFGQTQRAYQSGMRHVDVLEAGRSAMEAITREFKQITVSATFNQGEEYGVNLFATNVHRNPLVLRQPGWNVPMAIQDVYFLAHEGGLSGRGFVVAPGTTNLADFTLLNNGVGALYYFSTNHPSLNAGDLFLRFEQRFIGRTATNRHFSMMLPGVVHFRTFAYDTNGFQIQHTAWTNGIIVHTNLAEGQYYFEFQQGALPAYLEVELGIMEPQVIERARGLADASAQREFLQSKTDRIHIFRQTIPIRSKSQ
jgi:hypothetical protein